MALIIGSVALNNIFGYEYRKPKDLDYFGEVGSLAHTDLGIAGLATEPFWHESFKGSQLDRDGYATLDEMYTIKVSHAYWALKNGSWNKHIYDMIQLRRFGAKLDMDLHKLLYPVWVETHGRKQMNLSQAAGDFFADAVTRIYDHDSIHRSCSFGDEPLYEAILKNGETVDIDPDKLWNGLSFEDQVLLFREEIAATALERWMIPTKYRFSAGLAYKLALRKTIVSLTRGRSARFIVTNYEQFSFPHNYMQIHFSKLDKLEPFTGKAMM